MGEFKIGEKLVHPKHGICVLEHIGPSPLAEGTEEFYQVRLLRGNARILAAKRVRLRRPAAAEDISRALRAIAAIIEGPLPARSENFYRQMEEKAWAGTLEGIAEAYGTLKRIMRRRTLHQREATLYSRIAPLLTEEIAYVKEVPEDEAKKMLFQK